MDQHLRRNLSVYHIFKIAEVFYLKPLSCVLNSVSLALYRRHRCLARPSAQSPPTRQHRAHCSQHRFLARSLPPAPVSRSLFTDGTGVSLALYRWHRFLARSLPPAPVSHSLFTAGTGVSLALYRRHRCLAPSLPPAPVSRSLFTASTFVALAHRSFAAYSQHRFLARSLPPALVSRPIFTACTGVSLAP